ncbi:trichohyalin-like isoform X3 [Halichondria panicea]|uniref:trichohyalin-like isoform X3 n=1 Tax=Halichondria panicea TaxID=6063 RepID=UPI00312BAED1
MTERKLKDVHKKMAETEKTSQLNMELIRKKLHDMLFDWQATEVKQKSVKHREKSVSSENRMLHTKIRSKVNSKPATVTRTKLEADTSTSKSSYRVCLTVQNPVLKSKVEAFSSQLVSRNDELAVAGCSRTKPLQCPPISSDVSTKKTKIGELQTEIKLQRQQMRDITTLLDSLLRKIDSLSMQILTSDTHLSREKCNDMVESKLVNMSDKLHSKIQELEYVLGRKDDLQLEVISVRKELHDVQDNVTVIEANLARLQEDYDKCCENLAISMTKSTKLEKQLLSVSTGATYIEKNTEKLQASLKASENSLENTLLTLSTEKTANEELRISVDRLSGNLDRASEKVNYLTDETTLLKEDVALKKQDILHMHQEARSLKLKWNDSQERNVGLESKLKQLQQDIKIQGRELTTYKETSSVLRQNLTKTSEQQGEDVRSVLAATKSEQLELFKSKEEADCELNAKFKSQYTLSGENGLQAQREEELYTLLTHKNLVLTSELQGLNRDIQSNKSEIYEGLTLKCFELEKEKRKNTELELCSTKAELQDIKEQQSKLRAEMEQTKRDCRGECQRTLFHKRAEPGKTVENMQCRLDCESEKNSTLQLELCSTKAELQDIKEQQSAQIEQDYYRGECQRTLSHKRAEPGKTVENMQCRLDCESEKYSTLQLELYSTKAELQDIKEQQSKLRAEMEQTERDCRGECQRTLDDKREELRKTVKNMQCRLDCESEKYSTLQLELCSTKAELQDVKEQQSAQIEQTERDYRGEQCQRTLDDKREELRKSVENMQCRLDCESEKNSTLQLELCSTKAELQDIKEQQSKLRAEMEQTERDCRVECQRTLADKREELRKTVKNMQCRLDCESEKYSTLQLELCSTKAELQDIKEQQSAQIEQTERDYRGECQRTLDDKREGLRKSVENMQCRLDCESEKNSTLQLELCSTKTELQDIKEQQSAQIEQQSAQIEQIERDYRGESQRMLDDKREELRKSVENMQCRLDCESEKNSTLQLELCSTKAELQDIKEQQSAQIEQIERDYRGESQRMLDDKREELRKSVENMQCRLDCESEKNSTLQLELCSTKAELQDIKEQQSAQIEQIERDYRGESQRTLDDKREELRKTVENMQCCLDCESEKNSTLQLELCSTKSELQDIKEQQLKLNDEMEQTERDCRRECQRMLADKREELRKAVENMQCRLDCESEKNSTLQVELCSKKAELQDIKEQQSAQIEQIERDCRGECQRTLADKREEMRKTVENMQCHLDCEAEKYSTLQLELHSTKAELQDIKEQQSTEMKQTERDCRGEEELSTQVSTNVSLKTELRKFKHMLDVERVRTESLASELVKSDLKAQEISGDLHDTQQQLCCAEKCIKETQTSWSQKLTAAKIALEQANLTLRLENEQVYKELSSTKENMAVVKHRLETCEEELSASNDNLFQNAQKRTQLESMLSSESRGHKELVFDHTELQSTHADARMRVSDLSERLLVQSTVAEQLKIEVTTLKQRLSAVTAGAQEFRVKSEREMQTFSQKYHAGNKSLKEEVKELQKNLQVLRGQYECRGEEINRLQATNQSLDKHQQDFSIQLSDKKEELQAKEDDCKNLQSKVCSLEVRVKQLDYLRGEAHIHYEQYKKKLEQQSRVEVQRLLSKVTQHLEQQHIAHKYMHLESLRLENEKIVLEKREREITQLRSELCNKKQESEQDKMHMQHMKVETRHLKAQQKDQEKSRRRLEARLEQVNNTLSRTLPTTLFNNVGGAACSSAIL